MIMPNELIRAPEQLADDRCVTGGASDATARDGNGLWVRLNRRVAHVAWFPFCAGLSFGIASSYQFVPCETFAKAAALIILLMSQLLSRAWEREGAPPW